MLPSPTKRTIAARARQACISSSISITSTQQHLFSLSVRSNEHTCSPPAEPEPNGPSDPELQLCAVVDRHRRSELAEGKRQHIRMAVTLSHHDHPAWFTDPTRLTRRIRALGVGSATPRPRRLACCYKRGWERPPPCCAAAETLLTAGRAPRTGTATTWRHEHGWEPTSTRTTRSSRHLILFACGPYRWCPSIARQNEEMTNSCFSLISNP